MIVVTPSLKLAEPAAKLQPAPKNWPFPSSDPAERYRMMIEHQAQQRDWLRHEPEGLF